MERDREVVSQVDIRVSMRESADGRWEARASLEPPVVAGGASRARCLAALRRALERTGAPGVTGRPLTLIVEVLPQLAGVAEAARIMAWDKRRVVTYIDRGNFPAPIQSLASGRVWRRDDVEAFATAWRARQAGRRRR
jgi:hypothetical protein